MNRKFKAGQLYELTKLLGELYSLEPFELKPYIMKRLNEIEEEIETALSVRRSSRGEQQKAQ